MEVKIGVCQRGNGMLELNVSRDGEVLVPGAQEAYENAYREEARVRGSCPICGVPHVCMKKWRLGSGKRQWTSDQHRDCLMFLEMNPEGRAARLEHFR